MNLQPFYRKMNRGRDLFIDLVHCNHFAKLLLEDEETAVASKFQ